MIDGKLEQCRPNIRIGFRLYFKHIVFFCLHRNYSIDLTNEVNFDFSVESGKDRFTARYKIRQISRKIIGYNFAFVDDDDPLA